MLCCGYTLTDFPISIRLTSLALWQSNDCPSASKATLMNMDKYFMWIHYEWLRNHNKAKHNKTVFIFLGIYCMPTYMIQWWSSSLMSICINHPALTHWGRVTHICVSRLAITGSDNGLSPGRRQAIIWANAGILLIGPLRTNSSENLIEILTFSFTKMLLKVSSAKWWPFCRGLNVLMSQHCWSPISYISFGKFGENWFR